MHGFAVEHFQTVFITDLSETEVVREIIMVDIHNKVGQSMGNAMLQIQVSCEKQSQGQMPNKVHFMTMTNPHVQVSVALKICLVYYLSLSKVNVTTTIKAQHYLGTRSCAYSYLDNKVISTSSLGNMPNSIQL